MKVFFNSYLLDVRTITLYAKSPLTTQRNVPSGKKSKKILKGKSCQDKVGKRTFGWGTMDCLQCFYKMFPEYCVPDALLTGSASRMCQWSLQSDYSISNIIVEKFIFKQT